MAGFLLDPTATDITKLVQHKHFEYATYTLYIPMINYGNHNIHVEMFVTTQGGGYHWSHRGRL